MAPVSQFTPQSTLARKIAGLALLNIGILAVAALAFGAWQFRLGPESLLLAPSRDRVEAIGAQVDRELNLERRDLNAVLAEQSQRHGVQFLLADPDGVILSRLMPVNTALPREVLERMHGGPPGPPPPRKGPPPDRDDTQPRPTWRQAATSGQPPHGPPRERSFFAITGWPPQYWAGVRIPYQPMPELPEQPAVLLIRAAGILQGDLFGDVRIWVLIAFTLAAVSALCWIPFLSRLTRDIATMQQATAQIASGRFDVDVPNRRGDEVGRLGTEIGRMASRLDHFVRDQKRFLGDIAHELSAPMARVQFAVGILEQKLGETGQAPVARLRGELEEMSKLVNELLSFSRADVAAATVERLPLRIAEIVEKAAIREGLNGAQLQVDVDPALRATANEVYLTRALANLLRNAARYAGAAGPIEVTAQATGADVSVEVADHGPGLPEAELERIFEPFYRPVPDRSRESGGTGLGLAIVKSCVAACGGAVECFNRKPTGLVVRIVLPGAARPPA